MTSRNAQQQIILPFATKFDQLSLSVCQLECIFQGTRIAQASGFFWRSNQHLYLITNWHVVTGKDAFTGQFLKKGLCADSLLVHYIVAATPTLQNKIDLGLNARAFHQKQFTVPLYAEYISPFWVQHENCLKQRIDVVMIRIEPGALGADVHSVICINDYGFSKLFHYVGGDVLIIGHPFDQPVPKFPVWKRGSIASELVTGWKMKPAFLVDCRTSKGMSGSPVIRRVFGPATQADMTVKPDNVVTSEFMGIYSGRLHDDENVASIGIVWWRTVIDEILQHPTPGDRG